MLEIIEDFEEGIPDNDYCSSLHITMKLNGKAIKSLYFFDGEPEDNNMGRNFSDVYSIVETIQLAYEAGKNGEEISFKSN